MNDRANNEKLRILQERLAQIKQRDETPPPQTSQSQEEIKSTSPQKERKPMLFKLFKVFVFSFCIAFGAKYAYNNIDLNSFVAKLNSSEEVKEELISNKIEYNLNLEGNNIAIVNSFEDESSAKAKVNDLKIKGYKCDYLFLPEKSNSQEEVYKVFIGPYENEEETNQWTKNLEGNPEIVKL